MLVANEGISLSDQVFRTFLCWNPDMGHEGPDDGEAVVDAFDVRRVAEAYVDQNFSDWSYPRNCTVMVRTEDGRTFSVDVEQQNVPSFHAATPKEVRP